MELTPPSRPRLKLAMGGSLAVLAIVTLTAGSPGNDAAPHASGVHGSPQPGRVHHRAGAGLLILDLRADPEAEKGIPGAVSGADPRRSSAGILQGTPEGTVVVVYDEAGTLTEAPAEWPQTLEYRFLEGGCQGGVKEVTHARGAWGNTLAERERVQRQNQISAFFSGAAVQSSSLAAPPPMMPAGGAGKKPKAGGC